MHLTLPSIVQIRRRGTPQFFDEGVPFSEQNMRFSLPKFSPFSSQKLKGKEFMFYFRLARKTCPLGRFVPLNRKFR